MASKLGRVVMLLFIVLGVSRPMFALEYASVTIRGGEQFANGVWDSGTVTVTVNGQAETVAYGQFSTPASIASALGVAFTKNCACQGGPACARANGAEIIFKGKNGASIQTITVSSASNAGFSPSFSVDTSLGSGGSPHISSLSPTSGKVGSQVIISGSGFGIANASTNLVTINGVVASATTWTDTSIVITVPDVASSGDVIVTSGGTASNGVTFTVTSDGTGSPILNGAMYSYTGVSYAANGNVIGFTDSVTGQWGSSSNPITYDSLNRLSSVQIYSGPYQGQGPYLCWNYDAFGNRTNESLSPIACNSSPTPTTWANYNSSNQVMGTNQAPGGYGYDTAGNVINDGRNQYVYDEEGRLCAVYNGFDGSYTQYIYDAEGNRVAKGAINSLSCDSSSNGFTLLTQYVVGKSGEQVSELDGSGTWLHSNVYAGGQLFGTYDASGFHFNLTDPLGTKRMQVLADLSAYEACESLPFGNSLNCYGPASQTDTGTDNEATEHHFTGKERDSESGNDYFEARYYGSSMGRFLSPDPSGLLAQHPEDPQSWNLYAYARNNPLINIDPNGLDCIYATNNGKGVESIDHDSNSGECGQNGGTWLSGYVYEDWAHYNKTAKAFEAASEDDGQVNFAQFQAGAQTNDSGGCLSGCGNYGFASTSADFLTGQLVGNSRPTDGSDPLDGLLTFMTKRDQAVTDFWKGVAGPINGKDNWAGPGGMGVPQGTGDWRAAVHDYNFNTNGITIGSYFNPTLSPATSRALIQSNNNLMRTGGVQGAKEKMIFGVINAFQWYADSWK